MPASAVRQGALFDPWFDHERGISTSNSKRARSAAGAYNQNHGRARSRSKAVGGFRQKNSTKARVLDKYEAALAKTLERGPGRPGSHSPAMDIWAMALGVDIDNSKATERARRKVELEEAGQSIERGGWATSVPPTRSQSSLSPRRRKRGRDALDGAARGQPSAVVPDVAALDGFLSDLQLRLNSIEGGAVRNSNSTVVPRPSGSVLGASDADSREYERNVRVSSSGGPPVEARAVSTGSADVYGIPQAFIANAEEVQQIMQFGVIR